MSAQLYPATTSAQSFDVVIIGGAIIGSSIAWFLSQHSDFKGRILVVERDPSYEFASTSRTNSCVRQQFSTEINIRISQFTAEYVKNFRHYMGGDDEIPDLTLDAFGYMYLADNENFAEQLRANQRVQAALGAGTKLMRADEIKVDYPFYHVDDILLGSHNLKDEGYFEGNTMFEWWRRSARKAGVEYIQNEVTALTTTARGQIIDSVTLATGERISAGVVVNDYMAGSPPHIDSAVAFDDFDADQNIWQDHVWPLIATRIPQFEAIKVTSSWAGHYAFNTLDHNAVLGPHPDVSNFIFANGFSGHGLQQSPAVGRGISEWIIHGAWQSLDFSCFSYERIAANQPLLERAVI